MAGSIHACVCWSAVEQELGERNGARLSKAEQGGECSIHSCGEWPDLTRSQLLSAAIQCISECPGGKVVVAEMATVLTGKGRRWRHRLGRDMGARGPAGSYASIVSRSQESKRGAWTCFCFLFFCGFQFLHDVPERTNEINATV